MGENEFRPTRAERTILQAIGITDETRKVADLGRMTGYSERSVRRILRGCEAKGWAERTAPLGKGRNSQYRIALEGEATMTACRDATLQAIWLSQLNGYTGPRFLGFGQRYEP